MDVFHGVRSIRRLDMLGDFLVHVGIPVHVDQLDAEGRWVGFDTVPFDLGGFGEVDCGVLVGGCDR